MDDESSRFRWSIAREQHLEASAEHVWSVISAPGNLERFHPFCASNPVDQWPGTGSRDAIHYYSGVVLDRLFKEWIDGGGYDLELFHRGHKCALVSWRLTPEGPGASRLRILVRPDIPRGWPVALRWLPHALFVRPWLRRYLRVALAGLAWHMRTGRVVRRNQFGRVWGF
ncbi:MAG: SRPBCC family protein [Thermoanaerobaculia bacterium]